MSKHIIGNNEKCRQLAGDFDCHGNAAMRCGVHHPMEHIRGILSKPLDTTISPVPARIPPAAAMVIDFE